MARPHTLRMMRAVNAAMSAPAMVVAAQSRKTAPTIIWEAGNVGMISVIG